MMKKCSTCGQEKQLNSENFHIKRGNKDGWNNQCKVCKRESDRKRYRQSRKKISIQKAEYYQKNKESIKKANKEYYYANKAKILL